MNPLALVDAVTALRAAVAAAPLSLDVPGAAQARREQAALTAQIDDYLLPRLRALDAPLLVVVGGSTGAGKSTLVNSLLGAAVTAPGVLRPTTRGPVLACHPDDQPWFHTNRILPTLSRTTGRSNDPKTLRIVPTAAVPPGLALLDAPDIDSVVTENRELAAQLLAAADLWLFVTTAARYADAVPWAMLQEAQERSTALAVVLDRVPPEALGEVAAHLRDMLLEHRLDRARLFTVAEVPLVDGALPPDQVAPLQGWLHDLAADADSRAAVVRTTLSGALDALGSRVPALAAQLQAQGAGALALRRDVESAYELACGEIDEGVRSGSLLRGEVLARWQEFVGTGELMRNVEGTLSRWRDRVVAAVTGRPRPAAPLRQALESSVSALVVDSADRAAERSVLAWRAQPAGRALLGDDAAPLSRASRGLRDELPAQVRAWQARVLELVSQQGQQRRLTARVAALGINTTGILVMIAVFLHTGGLTGGEIAVAGGTGVVGQRVLEAIFGDAAVRALSEQAREDLLTRLDALLDPERERFLARLPSPEAADAAGVELRAALAAVARARRERATA